MKRFWCAALALLISATPAMADTPLEFSFRDASVVGTFGCKAKYPGSFRRGVLDACYSCPKGFKRNHPLPIGSGKECKQPGGKIAVRFVHISKPKFGVRPCPGKPKFNAIAKICYICPAGARLDPFQKRCERKVPAKHAKATYRGERGCPDGSFRNGLGKTCLKCPSGYVRAKLWKKVEGERAENACMRAEIDLIKPPKWLKVDTGDWTRAIETVRAQGELIAALGRAADRLGKALKGGAKLKDYRDEVAMREIAEISRRTKHRHAASGCGEHPFMNTIQSVAFGNALDGSVQTPFGPRAGGNATLEFIADLTGGGAGQAWAIGLNAGAPGEVSPASGEFGAQATAYTRRGAELPSWTLVWEGGALGKGKMPIAGGGEVAIAMSVEKGCPIIVGVTVGLKGGFSSGIEADIGPVFSHYSD